MLWTECLYPLENVEALTPSVMIFGSGTFGRFTGGHEGRAAMMELLSL